MRLIVSFIGTADLRPFVNGEEPLNGPIVGLLSSIGKFPPARKVASHKLVLLDDDREGETVRARFAQKLRSLRSQFGYPDLEILTRPIVLEEGPTDFEGLFRQVWSTLQAFEGKVSETVFHLSSGTPAMHTTLLLAAHSFSLGNVRLMETSVQRGLVEVKPPFFVGVREAISRPASPAVKPLPGEARRKLISGTVIDDPTVEHSFSALHKASSARNSNRRALITGPPGTGKYQAARQFALWQNREVVDWAPGMDPEAIDPDRAILVIRRIEEFSDAERLGLRELIEGLPGLSVAVTSRLRPIDFDHGKRIAGLPQFPCIIELPALKYRLDLIAIAESLGTQEGILVGKMRSRLSWHFRKDESLIGFSDLRDRLVKISTLSDTAHPVPAAYDAILEAYSARLDLETACMRLMTMDFEGTSLPDQLDLIQLAALKYARSISSSQAEAAERVGMRQQNVSKILRSNRS